MGANEKLVPGELLVVSLSEDAERQANRAINFKLSLLIKNYYKLTLNKYKNTNEEIKLCLS